MCVLIFSAVFVWNVPHSKKNWVRCDKKNVFDLYVKYLLFLSDFNETWIFPTDFFKYTQISDFMKFHPVEAVLFHADWQTWWS